MFLPQELLWRLPLRILTPYITVKIFTVTCPLNLWVGDCCFFGVKTVDKSQLLINSLNEKILLRKLLEKTLCSFGISPMLRGYEYIIESELVMFENSDNMRLLVNEVYSCVAIKCYTTASRVERAIKHAIEISWSWNGEGSLKKQCSNDSLVPTNKQFLDFLHQRILETIQKNIDNTSDCLSKKPESVPAP